MYTSAAVAPQRQYCTVLCCLAHGLAVCVRVSDLGEGLAILLEPLEVRDNPLDGVGDLLGLPDLDLGEGILLFPANWW